MIIALDPIAAPKTVNSFVVLARYHYYDGIVFHRIIPGFVLQGGDPEGTGRGGPGYQFEDELPSAGRYELGSLAMANAGPNTNGSQFFVISGPDGMRLPPQYSLFGKVVKGLDVVEAIDKIGTRSGSPTEPVTIESVTITEKD
jgi:cyclophilin family peptidyl-prolyl cis-trans isomerase